MILKDDIDTIAELLSRANNRQLNIILNLVENEIRLSDISIEQGFER